MSFYLADENGYIADLASTLGLQELYDHLSQAGTVCINELLAHGYCVTPRQLLDELVQLPPAEEHSVRSSMHHLVILIKRRCMNSDVVIVGNGEAA